MSSENKSVEVPANFKEIIERMADAVEKRNNEIFSAEEIQEDSLEESPETPMTESINPADDVAEEPTEPIEKKTRGVPRSILLNQAKHTAAMEKQQRMINAKKGKQAPQKGTKPVAASVATPVTALTSDGTTQMQRMIVGGKVKYVPVKTAAVIDTEPIPTQVIEEVIEKVTEDQIEAVAEEPKKLPPKIAANMERYNKEAEKKGNTPTVRPQQTKKSSKVPSRYAQHVEKEVKQSTTKNVRNFTELRKIRLMEGLQVDSDINKTSMIELRKLKMEQRKSELIAAKKLTEANKKESAVKNILNDEKMSKFSKTVAIKNLSVNSRNQKTNRGASAQI